MKDIEQKVYSNERLTFDDGVRLFKTNDILTLGRLANYARQKRHKDYTYYVKNMHINYTNICKNLCKFCAFGKRKGEDGTWQLSLEEIFKSVQNGLIELHIVGGINPDYPYEFYIKMLEGLKDRYPNIHLKAFTAVEIDFISRLAKKPLTEVLLRLKNAGLDSLPGGGAEVFSQRVHDAICTNKIDAQRWLEIHRTAHNLGIRSTATMLYGHIETIQQRVEHMLMLRSLQDETGGFTAFVPLAFQPENTGLSDHPKATGITDLKVHAIARLLLDNFDHIKAYWVMTGVKMAQVLLDFGVDDLDGTVISEKIAHMAGAESPSGLTEGDLMRLIKEAHKIPVQRDSLYNQIKVYDQ